MRIANPLPAFETEQCWIVTLAYGADTTKTREFWVGLRQVDASSRPAITPVSRLNKRTIEYMPLPRALRRIGRFVNPAVMPLARRVPPLAIIHHIGRKSGRAFKTPVLAFETEKGWIVTLAYGTDVQWARNLQSVGGGELTRAGKRYRVGTVTPVSGASATSLLPRWARVVMKLGRVDDYLLLSRAGEG